MKLKILLPVIMSTLLLLAPCAFAQRGGEDPDSLVKKFQDTLERDGFSVKVGAAGNANMPAQWCAGKVDSALYANYEPYLMTLIPKSVQDPQPVQRFNLRPDEAIVLIGMTPPPAKYFSYTAYVWSKMYPDGKRLQPMASLGDSVNNVTVKTTGSSPFNSPVVLIFTPDQTTDASVRAALHRAGYPAAIINTVVIPVSILNLGYGENADDLTIAARNAIWQDPDAGASYIDHPPLAVFRITPQTPATANPFPAPTLRIRGTGQTEMALTPKLVELRQGIIAAYQGHSATDIVLSPMCNEGYDLIQRGLELCVDTRDAFYVGAGLPEYDLINKITLADGEFLMIYGPNHVATGKATYMNTNVYASEKAKLTLGSMDDREFTGKDTATPYLPVGDPATDLMYAYKISRNCGEPREPNCLQLSAPEDCTRLTLDSSTLLGVFTRIYLEPATRIGPAMPEILYDRVIKFSPRP